MPRTRSLAWSELKIGIVSVTAIVLAVLFIFAVGGQAGFFWQQVPPEDSLRRRPGAEGRRRDSCRRRRGGQGRRDCLRRFGSRGQARGQEGDATADYHRVARVDRLAEPPGRACHRRQPRILRHSAEGRRHPAVGAPQGSVVGRRRERDPVARADQRDAQGHPRRQGNHRQSVHRRRPLQGDQPVRRARRRSSRRVSATARARWA